MARRQAYHDRRAQERAEFEELNAEEVLVDERHSDVIVRVAASTIVVEAEGPNYVPGKPRSVRRRSSGELGSRPRRESIGSSNGSLLYV